MNPLWVILIVGLVLIYVVSPYDLIPDLMPLLGRIDDIGLVAVLIYYLKTGRVPGFVSRIMGWFSGGAKRGGTRSQTGKQGSSGSDPGRNHEAGRDPYAVLGLSPGASNKEIHEAYRKLAQQYHPDKVSHLGKEFQELASRKFVEIQEAYETLTGNKK
ncbi:MAG: DnaJ domain-containing protein [Thermodesulfobacteriota bacterium]